MSCGDDYNLLNNYYYSVLKNNKYSDVVDSFNYGINWNINNLIKDIMPEITPKFERSIDITDSDWVEKIWYDVNTLTLDMKTHSGKRYRYPNISSSTFARIVTDESVGKMVNKELRELNHTTV